MKAPLHTVKSATLFIIVGLIIGSLLTGIVAWNAMPNMMLQIHKSKLNFEETVAMIEKTAKAKGWSCPKIYNIQGSLQKEGYDMNKLKIISLCHPKYASTILSQDENKRISAFMPCRVGVYEDAAGQVFVAEVNMGLMSKMFGGNIGQVLSSVAVEEKQIVASVLH